MTPGFKPFTTFNLVILRGSNPQPPARQPDAQPTELPMRPEWLNEYRVLKLGPVENPPIARGPGMSWVLESHLLACFRLFLYSYTQFKLLR